MAKPKTKRAILDALKDEFCDTSMTMKNSIQVIELHYKKLAKEKREFDARREAEVKAVAQARADAELVAPAPVVEEEAPKKVPVVKEKVPVADSTRSIEDEGARQNLNKKLELVQMLQKTGITEAHAEMSVNELKSLYKSWQAKQGQTGKDKSTLGSVNAMINETTNKVVVQRGKAGLIFPRDFREARREDIGWLKVNGNIVTIVYKAGAKVNYDIRSCKQIQ